MLLVGDGDGVHALPVGPDDGVRLEAEDDGLGDWAEHGHGPSHHQQPPGAVDRGPVGDGEHDGRESVKRDHNHDEAREINANNPIKDHDPTGDIIS